MADTESDEVRDLIWRPNPRQAQFLELPNEVFEGLYGGAVFGGKSEVLLKYPIARGWTSNGRFKGIIFRRSYPELEASLIRRTHEPDGYAKFGGVWNDNKHVWTFPSGAWIKLSFIEKDADARAYDTAEFNFIAFDQLEHFTEWQYTYMISRCRSNSAELPSVMRSAANPGGPGTAWVRERFVRPFPDGGKILRDKVTNTLRIFIPAKLEDNIEGVKRDPGYKNRMMLLPEAERKAKLDGDWFALVGQVFPEFRHRNFPGESSNALHVIKPFEIPTWWPRIAALDWGFRAKTAILWGAVSPDDRLFIYREHGVRKTNISTWSGDFARLTGNESLRSVVLDPSAWQKRGDPMTISEQFELHSGFSPERADNDREGGALLLHDLLRWETKTPLLVREDKFDMAVYSDLMARDGRLARDYYNSFLPQNPENPQALPKLQIFENCQQLIETIPLCVYKKDEERVDDFDGDDFYDCLRYMIKRYHLYLAEGKKEGARRKVLGEIYSQFDKDQDHFALNMRLMKHEANQKKLSVVKGVRMFR